MQCRCGAFSSFVQPNGTCCPYDGGQLGDNIELIADHLRTIEVPTSLNPTSAVCVVYISIAHDIVVIIGAPKLTSRNYIMARRPAQAALGLLLLLLLLDSAHAQRYGSEQQPINNFQYAEACPDYTQYASFPQ
jgi:hypothetical protein